MLVSTGPVLHRDDVAKSTCYARPLLSRRAQGCLVLLRALLCEVIKLKPGLSRHMLLCMELLALLPAAGTAAPPRPAVVYS